MKKAKDQSGFTLIEIIVVVAILAILSAIAVPMFINAVERSRLAADQANLRTLNNVTPLARLDVSVLDPFIDENKTDQELIEFLVNNGYLTSVVKAQSKNSAFVWLIEDERWSLILGDSIQIIYTPDIHFTLHHISKNRIIAYDGNAGKHLVIPPEIEGVSIKEILGSGGKGAFQDKEIESVLLPAGIEIIGNNAFNNNFLTTIVFPEGLKSIGISAFRDNQITEVVIPNSVTSIGESAFHDNPINKITIGDGVEIGGSYSFGSNRAPTHFKTVYESPSGGAGTYIWNGVEWVKQ